MNDVDNKAEQITDVAVLARHAELTDIRLISIDAGFGNALADVKPDEPQRAVDVRLSPEISWLQSPNMLAYEVVFNTRIGEEHNPLYKARIVYGVSFALVAPAVENSVAEKFGNTTVFFAVYPYIREILQSITAKSGLPPLLLGLFKMPLTASAEEVVPSK